MGPFSQTSLSCEHKATVNSDLYFMLNLCTYSASHGRNLIVCYKYSPRIHALGAFALLLVLCHLIRETTPSA